MKCIVSIPGFGQYAFTVHTVVNGGKSVHDDTFRVYGNVSDYTMKVLQFADKQGALDPGKYVLVEYHHDVGKPVNPGDSRRK